MGWFQKLIYGVDLDATQSELDRTNAALASENAADYGRGGTIYRQIQAERGTAAAEQTYADVLRRAEDNQINVTDQVHGAFRDGYNESLGNITGGIRATLAAPFNFAIRSIPWQLWLVGLVALFIYMGGGVWLKGLINRHWK